MERSAAIARAISSTPFHLGYRNGQLTGHLCNVPFEHLLNRLSIELSKNGYPEPDSKGYYGCLDSKSQGPEAAFCYFSEAAL